MSQTVDLRGFHYQLAPVHQLAQWELDRLRQKLALAQTDYANCETVLSSLKQRYGQVTQLAKDAWISKFNVASHAHALNYLQALQVQIQQKMSELQDLMTVLDAARHSCVEQQRKLELIDTHKADAMTEYAMVQENTLSSEADRDWSARTIWRNKQNAEQLESW